jgi:hypothetical protein
MLKIIALIIFISFLGILEISCPFIPEGLSLIFILLTLLLLKEGQKEIIKKSENKNFLLVAFISAGFFFDIYSVLPPGTFFCILLIIFLIANKFLLYKFNFNKPIGVFIFSFLINIIFQILIVLANLFFRFLNIFQIKVIFDEFYFLIVFQGIFLNSLLGLITSLFLSRFKLIKNQKVIYYG